MSIEISNYPEAYKSLQEALKKEAGSYSVASIAVAVASFVMLIFAWPVGLLLAVIAIYLWFNSRNSKKKGATLYDADILKKEHHRFQYWHEASNGQGEQREIHRFRFIIGVTEVFAMTPEGLVKQKGTAKPLDRVVVNNDIYQKFHPGKKFCFVFSGAGDLVAFVQDGVLNVLVKPGLPGTPHSTSVPQLHIEQDKRTGWVLLEAE